MTSGDRPVVFPTITDRDLDVLERVAEERFSTAELLGHVLFVSGPKASSRQGSEWHLRQCQNREARSRRIFDGVAVSTWQNGAATFEPEGVQLTAWPRADLEIERSLKSKKRRQDTLELRAKIDARFLYVVPESLWEAVKETVPFIGFESGMYWLSEADARQGRLTVKCKCSDKPW